MESVEEPALQPSADDLKTSVSCEVEPKPGVEPGICYTSNGIAESTAAAAPLEPAGAVYTASVAVTPHDEVDGVPDTPQTSENLANVEEAQTSSTPETANALVEMVMDMETTAAVEHLLSDSKATEDVAEEFQEEITQEGAEPGHDNLLTTEVTNLEGDNTDGPNDQVTFKTEVLVEKNDNESQEASMTVVADKHDHENNILNELGHGMELSEALRSSDTIESTENNNCSEREEMFNKEELLDILEGNDVNTVVGDQPCKNTKKMLEAQIALNQLSKLKRGIISPRPKQRKDKLVTPKKRGKKKEIDAPKDNDPANESTTEKHTDTKEENCVEENKPSESILNSLVKDWEDDEHSETEHSNKLLKDSDNLLKATEEPVKSEEVTAGVEVTSTLAKTAVNKDAVSDSNKSGDETQTRRQGRVIKKKVIFDPDNPDTFTKGKVYTKTKEPISEKEQTPSKKSKLDQIPSRSKSKSPIGKSQWKKPTPKGNTKQNRRLTEIDKLLMDEGAVNMICQLTPEAPKGKKNMKTKAEFIKKIQSSTPDGKEMKFRERKNKSEEVEAKRILGGKQRGSLSSSVKSLSVCEDFETHSADDSIIYRRHSSSSYSSSCMSPRRMSDGDGNQSARAAQATGDQPQLADPPQDGSGELAADVFMADNGAGAVQLINKTDCLTLKKKLNSKLSHVLNKRKRENNKTDKPAKQKKVSKVSTGSEEVKEERTDNFKYVSVTFDQRVAEICIGKAGSTVEIMKELEQALQYTEERKDVSVTLLTSECGTLCTKLDLTPLLDKNIDDNATEIAESIRSMLQNLSRHSKLIVSGVWGACGGLALGLLALSDVALAAEGSTFATGTTPSPGVTALNLQCRHVSQSLINDLVVFGRQMSCSEAQAGGLVDRALWPGGAEQIRTAAKAIAAQPTQSLLLKKQLLNLKKTDEWQNALNSGLEKERDLLVEYWTSVEGQDLIRASLDTA